MSYALVVVDYQVDFVSGSLGSEDAIGIEDNIIDRIKKCINEGGDLFFTMDTHSSDYLETDEGSHIPTPHCIKGTPGWESFGKIGEYRKKGTVIEKDTFGTFDLVPYLKGYDEIELCGVATDICVIANAVILKTAYSGSIVTVRQDCVASYDRELHEKALDVMRSLTINVL